MTGVAGPEGHTVPAKPAEPSQDVIVTTEVKIPVPARQSVYADEFWKNNTKDLGSSPGGKQQVYRIFEQKTTVEELAERYPTTLQMMDKGEWTRRSLSVDSARR